MSSAHVAILAYHQITGDAPPGDPSRLSVSVGQFERQMRYLHERGYRCLSLLGLLRSPHDTPPRPRKAVVLTFDDGYEDFFTRAWPILRRYRFTATVFLVTDRLAGQSDWEGEKGTPLLTWEQVEALDQDGISFGSHTCTHRRLTRLSSEQIWHELTASKDCLEFRLGHEIPLLAYPYGASNDDIQSMAMQASYRAACGVDTGSRGPFNLWRCTCRTDDSLLAFALKLTSWGHSRAWLREETTLGQVLRMIKRATGRGISRRRIL